MDPNYYQILGVNNDATPAEIKSAYRKAALINHPDKNGDASGADFVKIKEAYDTLSNESSRVLYDNKLRRPTQAPPNAFPDASYNGQSSRTNPGPKPFSRSYYAAEAEQRKKREDDHKRRCEEQAREAEERIRQKKMREEKQERANENSRRAAERAREEQQQAAKDRLAKEQQWRHGYPRFGDNDSMPKQNPTTGPAFKDWTYSAPQFGYAKPQHKPTAGRTFETVEDWTYSAPQFSNRVPMYQGDFPANGSGWSCQDQPSPAVPPYNEKESTKPSSTKLPGFARFFKSGGASEHNDKRQKSGCGECAEHKATIANLTEELEKMKVEVERQRIELSEANRKYDALLKASKKEEPAAAAAAPRYGAYSSWASAPPPPPPGSRTTSSGSEKDRLKRYGFYGGSGGGGYYDGVGGEEWTEEEEEL